MLTIRLTRKGKKNQPFFRMVVADKRRSAKGGRSVDDVGWIDPIAKRKSLNKDRILYWIKNGAQPSNTVHNLLVSEKIIEGKKIHVSHARVSPESVAVKVEKPANEVSVPSVENSGESKSEYSQERTLQPIEDDNSEDKSKSEESSD